MQSPSLTTSLCQRTFIRRAIVKGAWVMKTTGRWTKYAGLGWIILAVLILGAVPVRAQLDPVPRQLLHLGAELSLHDDEPYGAYFFYYWNMVHTPATNQFLRLAIAPVYVDSELAFKGLLGENTDLAIGAFGGLYAN